MNTIEDTIIILLHDLLDAGQLNLQNDDFYNIKEDICELLNETIPEEFIDNETITDYIDEIIDNNKQTILQFNHLYNEEFVKLDKAVITKQINYLKQLPQPEQRTEEWYIFRHNLITASSAWKAFSSEKIKNALIYEKCKELDTSKYNYVNLNAPFHWGNKYEPISIQLYENKFDTKIEDFGCIKDDIYPFLGASPDGINIKKNNDKYGVMLEIKNVVSREITGIPKFDYWIQMQIQMNVCKLDYCDFLETKFVEYETKEEYKKDGIFNKSMDGKMKGMIMCFMEDNKPKYEYPPIDLEENELIKWENDMMNKNESENTHWLKNIYWKLEVFSCILIKSNKEWFKNAIIILKNLYDIIEYEKQHGYEHRASKKQEKKKIIFTPPFSGCVIQI